MGVIYGYLYRINFMLYGLCDWVCLNIEVMIEYEWDKYNNYDLVGEYFCLIY